MASARASETRSPSVAVTGSPGATRSRRNVVVSRMTSMGTTRARRVTKYRASEPPGPRAISDGGQTPAWPGQPFFWSSQYRKIWMGSRTMPETLSLDEANCEIWNTGT